MSIHKSVDLSGQLHRQQPLVLVLNDRVTLARAALEGAAIPDSNPTILVVDQSGVLQFERACGGHFPADAEAFWNRSPSTQVT